MNKKAVLTKDLFNIEAITIAPFCHSKRNGTVADSIDASYKEACKIYDLSANVFGWTTEYYSSNIGSLVGGCFGYSNSYTTNRG